MLELSILYSLFMTVHLKILLALTQQRIDGLDGRQ